MKLELVYVAHPVGAPTPEGIRANLESAVRWLAYLHGNEPGYALSAPWLGPLLAGIQDDANPLHRARGMRDNLEAARRCDGIVLCGATVSRGMQSELGAVHYGGGWIADLTAIGGTMALERAIAASDVVWTGPIGFGRARWQQRPRSEANQ